MSDEPQEQSNAELIQVAALLGAAASTDPRMAPLAKQARKLVLESDEAIAELFAGYMAGKQAPNPPQPAPIPPGYQGTDPNAVALELVKQAQSLIEKRQQ